MTTTTQSGSQAAMEQTSNTFLRAASGHWTATAPIWLMRQAGRYLPEYRAIKDRHGFLAMTRTPELAADVTLQPIRRFALDAAILFSDIMTPLPSMGVEVAFRPGPVIGEPVRTTVAVERLRRPETEEIAPFVAEAVRMVRRESPVPLIGFAGAPLTLAAYLVQGGGSPDYACFRSWLATDQGLAHRLLEALADLCARYLRMQVEAGAQAVQLFDSWAGVLDRADFATFGEPYARRVLEALSDLRVPRIYLAIGAAHLHQLTAGLPAEVMSVDWRTPLSRCREQMPEKVLQGNLDPALLLAPARVFLPRAEKVLRSGQGGPHIFNLGHGVLPGTDPDDIARLVDAVKGFERRRATDEEGRS